MVRGVESPAQTRSMWAWKSDSWGEARNHAVDFQNSGTEVICVILPRVRGSGITRGRVGVHRDAKDWMSSSQPSSSLSSL